MGLAADEWRSSLSEAGDKVIAGLGGLGTGGYARQSRSRYINHYVLFENLSRSNSGWSQATKCQANMSLRRH